MSNYVAILGRESDIAIAELESLYGSDNIKPLGELCLTDEKPDINLLGGSPKTAKIIGEFVPSQYESIDQLIFDVVSKMTVKNKKMNFGISSYLNGLKKADLRILGLKLKKRLMATGIRIRYVPNKGMQLNSAQVWHNKLDKEPNLELLLFDHKDKVYVARTIGVQNIKAYTKRDMDKPVRSPKVGMLPPKLAKIMINMATSGKSTVVLDPFCGTGTLLMEALLMDHSIYGSDISTQMIDASEKNLQWLKKHYRFDGDFTVQIGDAQEYRWPDTVGVVASEIYLGPPLKKYPQDIKDISQGINSTFKLSLKNLSHQLPRDAQLCFASPAWFDRKNQQYYLLPLVDELEELKYNLVDFKHVDGRNLIYRRPDQVVGRQILVLKRI